MNLIDRLPRNSAYFEALSDDEWLAQTVTAGASRQSPSPARARRRMIDWSPAVELLTSILDRLGELTQAVAAQGGAKPGRLRRGPYPVTAFDRALRRQREARHRALAARVLPPSAED